GVIHEGPRIFGLEREGTVDVEKFSADDAGAVAQDGAGAEPVGVVAWAGLEAGGNGVKVVAVAVIAAGTIPQHQAVIEGRGAGSAGGHVGAGMAESAGGAEVDQAPPVGIVDREA